MPWALALGKAKKTLFLDTMGLTIAKNGLRTSALDNNSKLFVLCHLLRLYS